MKKTEMKVLLTIELLSFISREHYNLEQGAERDFIELKIKPTKKQKKSIIFIGGLLHMVELNLIILAKDLKQNKKLLSALYEAFVELFDETMEEFKENNPRLNTLCAIFYERNLIIKKAFHDNNIPTRKKEINESWKIYN